MTLRRPTRRAIGFLAFVVGWFVACAVMADGPPPAGSPPDPPSSEAQTETETPTETETETETPTETETEAPTETVPAAHVYTGTAEADETTADQEADAEDGEVPSVCSGTGPDAEDPDHIWVDRVRYGIFWTVCSTAHWFDGFYGDADPVQYRHGTYGRAGLAFDYDETEAADLDTRFEARVPLPALERRVDAFLGRFDDDEFVTGQERSFSSLPPVFAETDTEWLLGLGYSPARGRRSRVDLDGGIKLDFPMDPFVRARYRLRVPFGEQSLLRFRQVVFWRRSLRFGITSQLDGERILGPRWLIRLRGRGTFAQDTEGVDWLSEGTIYHHLGEKRAVALQVQAKGETDAEVPVEEWSIGLIYRQRILRDWLFLELRGRVRWPREEPMAHRDAETGAAIGFEILFGDHPSLHRGVLRDPD